jgi:hypothetical protein
MTVVARNKTLSGTRPTGGKETVAESQPESDD